jgi:ABC-type lipoprotein release transport system permease subunit
VDNVVLILRIAVRNLQRHLRRSAITIFSIGFGLAVILWLQAILAGSNQNIIQTITSTYHGDMQIFRQDYRRDHLIQQSFDVDQMVQAGFFNIPGVAYAPRLLLPALVSSGEQSLPVILQGIDPEREAEITKVKESLVEGDYLDSKSDGDCKTRAAYISRSLAQLLNIHIGNKAVILAQAADGTLGNELLRVKGLFDTHSPEYDKGMVFTTLACVRQIGALTGAHEVAFRIKDRSLDPDKIRAELNSKISKDLVTLSWREAEPRLAAMVNFNDASIILVSIILFVVISLGILNAFLVAVFERTVEFGVMMALGTDPLFVVILLLVEGLLLGLAASFLGILVGAAVITYHSIVGYDLEPLVGKNLSVGAFQLKLVVYPIVNLSGSVKATLITILVVTLSTLYPAIRASRLKPIEAIRST